MKITLAHCWIFVSLLGFIAVLPAPARTYTVTATNDSVGTDALRGAILDANRLGGNNVIILADARKVRGAHAPLVFHLTLTGADEDAARTGDLDITRGSLTISGAVTNIMLDATGLGDRVFQVSHNASLTLINLTIAGGTAPGNNYPSMQNGESGGAIFNAGVLYLSHCTITNNASGGGNFALGNAGGSAGGDGGAVFNAGKLTMENCVVAGNQAGAGVDGAAGGNGGGIRNVGTCLLTACVISENRSGDGGGPAGNAIGFGGSGGIGGGIYNSGSILLKNCTVSANASGQGSSGGQPTGLVNSGSPGGWGGDGGDGAGIYNDGQMQITGCTVNGNFGGDGGDGGSFGMGGNSGAGGGGAGIFNASELNLDSSTISGNFCGNGGNGGSGSASIFNVDGSTGANGSNGGDGGGICNAGSLVLTSCTIVLNQTGAGGNGGNNSGVAPAASGGAGGNGGGLFNANTNTDTARNTLIAQNLTSVGGGGGTNFYYDFPAPGSPSQLGADGANGVGPDVAGAFTSQKFNLVGMADGSTGFTNGLNADQIGSLATPIDPLIGPLQMNGGPTPTHALLTNSPAIDQGNAFGIFLDQRGHRRPQNFTGIANAPGGDGSDIGAFELDVPGTPPRPK